MIALYVFSFFSAVFATNGVPHFVKGVMGKQHQTPFGKPSSAIVNVAWGWLNFAVAVGLLHYAHPRLHEYRAIVAFSIGVLAMSLLLAYFWSKHPEYNKSKRS